MEINWKIKRKLAKIFLYEYWSFYVFFLPLVPVWLYYAIKNRSFVYFTAVNPSIFLSGLFGESKKEILENIESNYLPKTIYLEPDTSFEEVSLSLLKQELNLPVILKPDVGERGNHVDVIRTETDLENYLHSYGHEKLIIQEYITYELELGVFYYRYPNGGSGISSVTGKEFLKVTGDGQSSIEQLLTQNLRASMQYERLQHKMGLEMNKILPKGEQIVLEPIGNHCLGTKFLNFNHLINDKLVAVFDDIARSNPGFFFGRYDLKVKSIEDLYQGKHIKIMELNGVTSEPAHIYDPSYSLFFAYRDVARNMSICAEIARQNHKKGVPYCTSSYIFRYLINHFKTHESTAEQPLNSVPSYSHY